MSEQKTTQAQQSGEWRDFMDGQVARMGQVAQEMARLQTETMDHAKTAIDEAGRMGKESLTWAGDLYAGWQRVALDTVRRATGFVTSAK